MNPPRPHTMTDAELGSAIRAAVPYLRWPPGPDVSEAVAAEIDAGTRGASFTRPRLSLPSRRRILLLIAAAVLAIAAAAVAARFAIDLGAIQIRTAPSPIGAQPTAAASGEDFGRPVTLAEATSIAGFTPVAVPGLGPPNRVWVDRSPMVPETDEVSSRVVMAWGPRDDLPQISGTSFGAVLMQFEGETDVALKTVFTGTGQIEETVVDGRIAYWTTGPHELDLLTDQGIRRLRVLGNILLWDDAGFAVRFESSLGLTRSVALADAAFAR